MVKFDFKLTTNIDTNFFSNVKPMLRNYYYICHDNQLIDCIFKVKH